MAITGVTGKPWRAEVTAWGAVVPWDGTATLDWHVAADDRWHTPAGEPTVRQRRVDGTAAFETRLRVPDGDVVQRIWSVADHGGLTIVSFDNESPLPVAVALTRRNLLTSRPPAEVPINGIDLSADSTTVLPVGHRASVSVALAHTRSPVGQLPPALPAFEQVARGWTRVLDRSSRLLVPDVGVVEAIAAIRCDLLLGGPPAVADDAAGSALAIGEIVRLGEPPSAWIEEIADAVELIGAEQGWDVDAALAAAAIVLQCAGERRAAADVERIAAGRAPSPLPDARPDDLRLVAWIERRLATGSALFPCGIPDAWMGRNFEVYDVPTGPSSSISFAVRWHGARPALLWEQSGAVQVLTAPSLDPAWSTADPTGEALWPAPAPLTAS
jgi:hypothetical protein